MKDISYELLDLLKEYGSGREGVGKILAGGSRPEVLYALSPMRGIFWSGWNAPEKSQFWRWDPDMAL